MQHVYSSDRRRRLWLINSIEKRSVARFQDAASALVIASNTETVRVDVEDLKRQLFAECGAKPSTRLRVELPGAEPMTVMLNRPYLVVGSDSSCDLRLNHEEIKPRQCYLQWINGRIFSCEIAPVQSFFPGRNSTSNGSWLNHQSIAVGPYQISLDLPESDTVPDESPLDRSQKLATELPRLGLQFEGVEQADNTWPADRTLTMIGRGSQCKLRLNHATMAIVHACLLRTSMGCWLIDISGECTTSINGRPIRVAQVDIGDTIQLGPFKIEVVTIAFSPMNTGVTKKPIIENNEFERSLPPIRFDRQPKSLSFQSPPAAAILQAPANLHVAVATDIPEESHDMHSESSEDEKNDNPIGVTDFAVADFIHQQQSELELLKSRLEKLTEIYSAAAGQLISKRMRDSLEAPVFEAMKSYDAMHQALSQLIRSVEDRVLQK